jgi:hypothetical protein
MDMHKCETCGKEFKSSHAMKIHAARAHGEKKAKPGQARWMPPASQLAQPLTPPTPERVEQFKALKRFGKALQSIADRATDKVAQKAARSAASKATAEAAASGKRRYMDFRVVLDNISPPIWRRFLLAENSTFDDLHYAIQDSMGWQCSHLFEFHGRKGRQPIAKPPFAEIDELDSFDEDVPATDKLKLSSYFFAKGDRCRYEYDFGDGWEHRITLRGIVEFPERFERRLLGGARACPPEDCGGPWGYETCCRAAAMTLAEIRKFGADNAYNAELADDADELARTKEWMGSWHPEAFALAAVKKTFDK